jgi:uncharacterized small protein (TIGR04563 family)
MADQERKSGPDVSKSDKRKQSLYFPETMLEEIQKEAQRLQRSMSWVVQRAWKHARKEIKGIPGRTNRGDDLPGGAGRRCRWGSARGFPVDHPKSAERQQQ